MIEDLFENIEHNHLKVLHFDKSIKNIIVRQEIETSFSEYIIRIQIKADGILVFEGYDGIEFGVISQKVNIPKWFEDLYIPDDCIISSEW